MDYSKFVTAILEQNDKEIAEQVEIIKPVLVKFLSVRYGASYHDAEDCVQNTLLIAIEKIRAHKINNPEALIYYLFSTAKHDYFKMVKQNREFNFDEPPVSHSEQGDQLSRLLDDEKMTILEKCIELLKPAYRRFIRYWLNNPDKDASVVADHFGISVNNAWTRKHRVIKSLKNCVKEKINL